MLTLFFPTGIVRLEIVEVPNFQTPEHYHVSFLHDRVIRKYKLDKLGALKKSLVYHPFLKI